MVIHSRPWHLCIIFISVWIAFTEKSVKILISRWKTTCQVKAIPDNKQTSHTAHTPFVEFYHKGAIIFNPVITSGKMEVINHFYLGLCGLHGAGGLP